MDKAKITHTDGKFFAPGGFCGGHDTQDEAEFCAADPADLSNFLLLLLAQQRLARRKQVDAEKAAKAEAEITEHKNKIEAARKEKEHQHQLQLDANNYRWLHSEAKLRGYKSVIDAILAAPANQPDGSIITQKLVLHVSDEVVTGMTLKDVNLGSIAQKSERKIIKTLGQLPGILVRVFSDGDIEIEGKYSISSADLT